ncbi:MAG: hypothetical protein ACK4NW_08135 [Roseinatronobacter sp.]
MVFRHDHAARFIDPPDITAMAADRLVLVMGSEVEWQRLPSLFGLDLGPARQFAKADSSLIMNRRPMPVLEHLKSVRHACFSRICRERYRSDGE